MESHGYEAIFPETEGSMSHMITDGTESDSKQTEPEGKRERYRVAGDN